MPAEVRAEPRTRKVPHPHDADFDFLDSQCDPNDTANSDPAKSGRNEDQDKDGIDNFADSVTSWNEYSQNPSAFPHIRSNRHD